MPNSLKLHQIDQVWTIKTAVLTHSLDANGDLSTLAFGFTVDQSPIHWCDLEANSLKTCIAKAHHEHAMKWAGDALSFAAIAVLLLLLLRPLARTLTSGEPGEITIRLPARRFMPAKARS